MFERATASLHVWAATDVGKVRAENEDCIGVGDELLQARSGRFGSRLSIDGRTVAVVVADGVGGHRGGKAAASLAVSAFIGRCAQVSDTSSLTALIGEVSEHVRLACAQDPATRGGSTTLAGMVFTSSGVIAFNVGDSRIYQVDAQNLTLLTKDHLTPGSTRLLTRFVGGNGGAAVPYCRPVELTSDCRFLLCTDGLFGPVPATALQRFASIPEGDAAVDSLITAALGAGAPDNVSVALCDYISHSGREQKSEAPART